MNDPALVNSIGLVLDIVGALMVWVFGLSPLLTSEGEVLTVDYADGRSTKRIQRCNRLSNLGMLLVVGGFVCQLVSNFL
jgi:hypothetical protein